LFVVIERADSLLFVAYAGHGSFRSMTGNKTADVAGRLLKHLGSPGWPKMGKWEFVTSLDVGLATNFQFRS
jgi:hypothetical protein